MIKSKLAGLRDKFGKTPEPISNAIRVPALCRLFSFSINSFCRIAEVDPTKMSKAVYSMYHSPGGSFGKLM